jgi:hypothetical protein
MKKKSVQYIKTMQGLKLALMSICLNKICHACLLRLFFSYSLKRWERELNSPKNLQQLSVLTDGEEEVEPV